MSGPRTREPAPAKLTSGREKMILAAVREGFFMTVAARRAGIHARTLRKWRGRAWASKERGESNVYTAFEDKLVQALAEAEYKLFHGIRLAADDDPEQAKWLLEKRWPKRWARDRQRIELTGKDGGPIELEEAKAKVGAKLGSLAARLGDGEKE